MLTQTVKNEFKITLYNFWWQVGSQHSQHGSFDHHEESGYTEVSES